MDLSRNEGNSKESCQESSDSPADVKRFASYRSLFRLLRSFPIRWGTGILLVVLLISDVASQLASPLLTQALVDGMSSGKPVGHLIVALIVVMIGGSVLGAVLFYVVARLGSRWVLKLRNDVSEKLLLAPVQFFQKERASGPASHLIKDSSLIQDLISQQTIGVISGVIVVIGCIVVMGMLDVVLTLVLLGIVLAAFLVTLPVAAGLTVLSQKLQQHEADSIASMGELLGEISLVKSLTAESSLIKKQHVRMERLFGFELKEIRIQSLLAPLAGIAISAGMIAILAFGSYRVSIGAITIGKLLAFVLYLFNIVVPLASFSIFVAGLNKAAGAADQLASFLDAPQEAITQGLEIDFGELDIKCNNLSFKFGQTPILENVCLTIPAGKTTALVGESGAGKTTLLNLLDRLYPVEEGQLLIGEVPASSVSLQSWRRQIALVSQSAPVIAGSLRENLTLGLAHQVEDSKLWQLIDDFGLSDLDFDADANSVPASSSSVRILDGDLRESGKNLSGGQRQRIAIIRGILRQPRLLLLDEATSALDSLTEDKVTLALAELAKDTTVVVSAHRLSTVINADQIVVMKEGRIIDYGLHNELFSRCRYYRELVQKQMLVAEGK